METILPSSLSISNYNQSIQLIEELVTIADDDENERLFFNRARNKVYGFEIKFFLRLQTNKYITAHRDVALHNLMFLNCDLPQPAAVSAVRDVMSELERWKEQSIWWWGMFREIRNTPGIQVLVLGRDDFGEKFELSRSDYERLAERATVARRKYSM